jgi:hypothetical protein
MTFSPGDLVIISSLLFIVAALYSSVGHGGASGYLAILALFSVPPQLMSSTALVLNLLVSGISFVAFSRSGYRPSGLLWPLIVGSVPAAFVGGMLVVPHSTYSFLLGVALAAAAIRLGFSIASSKDGLERRKRPAVAVAVVTGALIGLLSGIVGIGGGVFLGPILLFLNWSNVKEAAVTCAGFIFVNSLAALAGRGYQGTLEVNSLVPFLAVTLVGGAIGSYVGAKRLPPMILRRLLALVLLIAAVKLFAAG